MEVCYEFENVLNENVDFAFLSEKKNELLRHLEWMTGNDDVEEGREMIVPVLYVLAGIEGFQYRFEQIYDKEKNCLKEEYLSKINEEENSSEITLFELCLFLEGTKDNFNINKFQELSRNDLLIAINALALKLVLTPKEVYGWSPRKLIKSKVLTKHDEIMIVDDDDERLEGICILRYRNLAIQKRLRRLITMAGLEMIETQMLAFFYYVASQDCLYSNVEMIYDFEKNEMRKNGWKHPDLLYFKHRQEEYLKFAYWLGGSPEPMDRMLWLMDSGDEMRETFINALIIRYYDVIKEEVK